MHRITAASVAGLALGSLFAAPAVAYADPPPWAPAWGHNRPAPGYDNDDWQYRPAPQPAPGYGYYGPAPQQPHVLPDII